MNFQQVQSIYCIGIGGAGMSGLARMANQLGKTVSGSDLQDSSTVQQLRQEGITVHTPQQAENVPLEYDLYVYSDAVTVDNPERAVLLEHGLEQKAMSYFTAVGELMQVYQNRIAVSGTHGKTTTTAMLGLVMEEAAYDPSVIVGSPVKSWRSNVRVGEDQTWFAVEACEYNAHMLELHPTAIILNNIEEDHLDYYNNLDHIVLTFQKYINHMPNSGVLIVNADDAEAAEIGFDGEVVTFGIDNEADVQATNVNTAAEQQQFTVDGYTFRLKVPARYNVYNALGVVAYAKYLKIDNDTIQAGLDKFTGTNRRFEYMGKYKGADVVSDYAHHPTAIEGLLSATKEWYPNRRVIIVFQPHQHNRTKNLFNGFAQAFDNSELTIVQKIFDVAGREHDADQAVSSKQLVAAIEEVTGRLTIYSDGAEHTKKLLAEHVEKNDVVLIVGAGDIHAIAEELVD